MKPKIIGLLKKLGYIAAAIIVVLALLAVLGRVVTPYLDARRSEIEKWAGELIQAPITIENARISWFQYQPGVALSHVSILNKETSQPVLQAKVIKVFFSIPQSIWQRKLVPSGIMIGGADLIIHENAQGEFVIQGFPALGGYEQKPFDHESKMRDVAGWLASGPLIILRDIDLRYTGMTGQKRYVTLYNLRLANSDSTHKITGQAILHQELATEMQVAVEWRGDILQPNTISGRAYIDVTGLSLSQWFHGLSWQGVEIKKGILTGKGWVNVQHGQPDKIQANFEIYNLDIFSAKNKSTHHYQRFSGDMGWRMEGVNHIIAGDDILVDDDAHLWPVTNFYLKLTPNADHELLPMNVHIGYFDIEEGRDLISAVPYPMPESLTKAINEFDVKGGLEDLVFNFAMSDNKIALLNAEGSIKNVSLKSAHGVPAIKNLSAKIQWANQVAVVSLRSHDLWVKADNIFDAPLELTQLNGEVQYQYINNLHHLSLKHVDVMSNDLLVTANGLLNVDKSLKVDADINANLAVKQAAHIVKYLPTKIFDKSLSEWLRQAFLAGSAESGTLQLKGKLADFPFTDNNGLFAIKAQVKNVQLHYAPGWPDLTNIDAMLQFIGSKILIDLQHAKILNINIGQTHGEIPNLSDEGPATLTVVSTPIHTDFAKGIDFLHQSPLEKTIGKMFANVGLSGPIDLVLSLSVPLSDTDKTTVNGAITTHHATLQLVPWQLNVEKLNGVINFTENATNASALQASLFDKPLRLDLATIKNKSQSVVRATIYNNIALQDIENWLHVSFADIATGNANVKTEIDLAVDQPIVVNMQTNLQGIALRLPDQYSKAADTTSSLTANMVMTEGEPLKVKLFYANKLGLAAVLNRVKQRFTVLGVNLHLGEGDVLWPTGKGLSITGSFPLIDEEKLKTYLSANTGKEIIPLNQININVKKILLYGVQLTDAEVMLAPALNDWSLKITSPQLAGAISIPKVIDKTSTITADLTKVDIDSLANQKTESMVTAANSLPAISFSSDIVIYDGIRLGEVAFNSVPTANGIAIKNLSIDSSDISLQSSGAWIQKDNSNVTRLHGKATSKNVSKLLISLGFDAHNFEASDGALTFDLSWGNPPYALSMANLSGNANLQIGKGRIVEVSQGSDAKMDLGRMLNLFSLQSIPRRLSLDFSDVFQKGYSFDSLRGDFKFSNGNAQTTNMRFDGTLARVEIRGKIGVSQKDFDLILSVTPYVTASIPVAATLLTGQPVIGVAAWAVNKMIGSEVSKAVTYYYTVTGSWANPQWKEMK